ncbi:hypothetical protein CASFOL_001918 [Castilleja foliolosa]|uniref:Uncharacterized protein n=1 Tax=Castilleja foliolosa TaxID=1961234 RepID=A0ABD3EEQ5_9LAMI
MISELRRSKVKGNLCLTLLPTSDLRISFNGDDGSVERLTTLNTEAHCTDVEIEEIPADISGRSFLLKTSDTSVSYFWCSEKSKLSGDELIGKMKDLLMRKPSLSELTGISESRLNYFASHLRVYLTDTVLSSAQTAGILSSNSSDSSVLSSDPRSSQSSFNFPKSSRSKTNLIYLGSLSPRPSSFKDGLQKSLSSLRTAAREKLRRRGENYVSNSSNSTSFLQKAKLPEIVSSNTPTFAALNFLDVFGKSTELPISFPDINIPSSGPSHLSPQYCWCPIGNPPISSSQPFSLPPLSSLLSSASKPLLNVSELPPLDFPKFLSDPVLRLPTSQQFPTFSQYTPLMCDPIVHIPVIDVCSSGQGYLVTSIPPMVDPLLPSGESAVEKGARETLRMLINNQANGEQNVLGMSNSMSSVGLVLLSDKSMGKMRGGGGGMDDLIDQKEKPSSSSGSSGFDEGMG